MALHDISDKRIEEYVRYGIERSFSSLGVRLIGVKDIKWSREKADSDDETDESAEFHVYVEATMTCLLLDESCRVNITREGYLFTEESFESSLGNYDEFYPDVSWNEGVSNEYYQLSEELPKGLDFMVVRYLNDGPADLWRFLAAQKNPEEFIKKIHSKLLRKTVEKLWHEEV